jgi:hypothetical protein
MTYNFERNHDHRPSSLSEILISSVLALGCLIAWNSLMPRPESIESDLVSEMEAPLEVATAASTAE